jgi:isocitrate/isopropylmalate dehydrogenase
MKHMITLIPGDGIGLEVSPSGKEILAAGGLGIAPSRNIYQACLSFRTVAARARIAAT